MPAHVPSVPWANAPFRGPTTPHPMSSTVSSMHCPPHTLCISCASHRAASQPSARRRKRRKKKKKKKRGRGGAHTGEIARAPAGQLNARRAVSRLLKRRRSSRAGGASQTIFESKIMLRGFDSNAGAVVVEKCSRYRIFVGSNLKDNLIKTSSIDINRPYGMHICAYTYC